MISQSLYFELIKSALDPDVRYSRSLNTTRSKFTYAVHKFAKPRVLVIHRPSGRGFYLDHQYRHIVDVEDCQEPENPTDVEKESLCTHSPPAWALQIETVGSCLAERILEFDSFWLY